ncbi:lipopolysaccharide biosynthesis protein [Flammeovirga pectinis]|uniref:lipopolysaccharide biosynthesis protein n=1 Tax=Flammeovirga pectinis TaxID=2494373 RepID=UPI0012D7B840|nr:oligosaccharide flippase family protein [Flammeovirga pectinis]
MKNYKLFAKFPFIKDLTFLASGTILSQLIVFLFQPFLKRNFSPEDFGVMDVCLKAVAIISSFMALKFDGAIILPKKNIDAIKILHLILYISIFFFVLILLSIAIFIDDIVLVFEIDSKYKFWFFLIPFSSFFYILGISFDNYLIRKKRFKQVSISKLSRRSSEVFVQVLIGYYYKSSLIIGDLIGNIFYCVRSYKSTSINFIKFNKKELQAILVEYNDFPKYNVLPNILNTFVLNSLTFLILSKFTIKEVGFLELTQKILFAPAAILSISLGQMLLQRTSIKIAKSESILQEVYRGFLLLAAFSLLFFIVIYFFSEEIFIFLFGEDWIHSAYYSKILVVYTCFNFVFSPMGKILIALRRIKQNAIWQLVKFISVISLFFIHYNSIYDYLYSYVIINVILYIIYGIMIFSYSKKHDNKIVK